VLAPSLHMNLLGALLIVVLGFLFVTVSSRLTGEIGSTSNPISGMTVATLLLTCLVFLARGLDGRPILRHRALGRRHRVHRVLERRHDLAGPEDGLPGGGTPKLQQYAILIGALASALLLGPHPAQAQRERDGLRAGRQVAPQGLRTEVAALGDGKREKRCHGPQAKDDSASYRVWHKTDGRRARGQVPGGRRRQGRLAGGPGHQRRAHDAARRHRGAQVRRAEGHAGELHHQGHPRPGSCRGNWCSSA
jgi:hypothetical protein